MVSRKKWFQKKFLLTPIIRHATNVMLRTSSVVVQVRIPCWLSLLNCGKQGCTTRFVSHMPKLSTWTESSQTGGKSIKCLRVVISEEAPVITQWCGRMMPQSVFIAGVQDYSIFEGNGNQNRLTFDVSGQHHNLSRNLSLSVTYDESVQFPLGYECLEARMTLTKSQVASKFCAHCGPRGHLRLGFNETPIFSSVYVRKLRTTEATGREFLNNDHTCTSEPKIRYLVRNRKVSATCDV